MIEKAIRRTFNVANKRSWDKTFWVIDIHETMIKPNYLRGCIPTEWYPLAKEAMLKITNRHDICSILFTCSHPSEILEYREFFFKEGITFNYVNENPEVKTQDQGYGYYDQKFYMNVLLDDKAGFNPNVDWKYVIAALDNKEGIFNPGDWGFIQNLDYLSYDLQYDEKTLLRIEPDMDTDDWKFEVSYKNSDGTYFSSVRYNAPLLSMRHGDEVIKTVFNGYNLKDINYDN